MVRDNTAILPKGAVLCPEAKEYLQRALACLGLGLPVAAWAWTRKALDVLHEATEGPEED
jgi:hypothetical protein